MRSRETVDETTRTVLKRARRRCYYCNGKATEATYVYSQRGDHIFEAYVACCVPCITKGD